MNNFEENPKVIFTKIKHLLSLGVKDRNHTFHTPVFSTVNKEKLAESRVVVLRKFDEKNLKLNFHTDFRSPKIIDIKNNNLTSFVFYDSKIKIQIRIKSKSIIHNQNSTSQKAWDKTRLFSRKCYLTKKSPSSLTDKAEDGIDLHLKGIDPTKDESEIGYNNFTVIENIIKNFDWLYLDSSGHRRLNINIKNSLPEFSWVIP